MCLLIVAGQLVCDFCHESVKFFCTTDIDAYLHQTIWFRCVCLIGTIKSVISVTVFGIFQVFLKAQLDVASMSQTNQIVEEIEVVFVKVPGAFQELDHRKVKPRRRVVPLWIVAVVIPPRRARHFFYGPATCRPAVFDNGIM